MVYIILLAALAAILILPQYWVKSVMKKYNQERGDLKGTGFEFAKHLLARLGYDADVTVEATEKGDHYDPQAQSVRLNRYYCFQKSLTAIVIAAHEVGHVIQDKQCDPLFRKRQKLGQLAIWIQRIAPVSLAIAPVLFLFTKSPAISGLAFLIGFLAVGMGTLVSLITLPVELDASFNKALPLLEEGRYLEKVTDYKVASIILRAAALTYVAQSLFNLLNVGYWLRLLRR